MMVRLPAIVLALALLCAAAPPAWAGAHVLTAPVAASQAGTDPFQVRVERAGQALIANPRAALEALDTLAVESTELRKTRMLTPAERAVHARLFVFRARGHMQALNHDKADDSYRELLRIDPFFKGTLPPREQDALDAVRTREGAVLEVTSRVRDCRVLVDGLEIGTTGETPVKVSLVAGTYQVRLEKPPYEPAVMAVTLVAGQTVPVTGLAPKAQTPPLAFVTDRPGVSVLVDNVPAGTTAPIPELKGRLSLEEATALDEALATVRFDPAASAAILIRDAPVDRPFSVRFLGDCLIEETRPVSIGFERLAAVAPGTPLLWLGDASAVRLRPDVGTLRVMSAPADADVFLDGQLLGPTPFERNVCSGEHRVRVRHAIGSYAVTAVITRSRTEVLDVTLKPGLGFLGAVETAPSGLRPSPQLADTVDRVLAASVRNFRLATPMDLPPDIQRWSDTRTADLVAASDAGDADAVKRLLRLARENFDAPLLMAAAARPQPAGGDAPVDLLLFWSEHAGVDRVRVATLNADALAAALDQLDRPSDGLQLIYRNDLGLRLADTRLPEAPLLVVSVDAGGPAAIAGVKPGAGIVTIDGAALTGAQFADLVARKKPGDILTLGVSGPGSQSRPVAVSVQRRPQRAAAFDPAAFGNGMLAKLLTSAASAPRGTDRELLNFSLALVYMRFHEWRPALDLLGGLGTLPQGFGVSAGAAAWFRARCHVELGERDRAIAILRDLTGDAQPLADDGASVGTLATLLLAALSAAK